MITVEAGDIPELAAAPVEFPRFEEVKWRERQVFTVEDDPDRMAMAWEPPSFVHKDPAERRACTTVDELELPRGCSSFGGVLGEQKPLSFARVVHGVLEEQECVELIQRINHKGFTPALLNIGRGQQQLISSVRDGHRVIVDSKALSTFLLEVVRPYLPVEAMHAQGGECHLEELNERCRFLLYPRPSV